MPSEKEAYNSVQLIGNLGADTEVRFFESGSRVAECRVAVYNGKDKRTNEPKPPMWFTVKAWNATADVLAEFRKGDRLRVIEGQLAQDSWQDRETGKGRTKDYVLAWKVEKMERQTKPAEAISSANTGVYDYEDVPF